MVAASRPTVDTDATLIASNSEYSHSPDVATKSFILKNATGTAPVFLGDGGVTAANGFEWAPGDGPLSIDLEPGEQLYGIVGSTEQDLHVLQAGR